MDRTAIVAALRVLPDDATLTLPVPTLRQMLGTESGGDELLSVAEVARLVNRKPGSIRNWIRKGRLQATKVGRAYRVTRDDFNEFLNLGSAVPAPELVVGSLTSAEGRMSLGTWREKRRGGAG